MMCQSIVKITIILLSLIVFIQSKISSVSKQETPSIQSIAEEKDQESSKGGPCSRDHYVLHEVIISDNIRNRTFANQFTNINSYVEKCYIVYAPPDYHDNRFFMTQQKMTHLTRRFVKRRCTKRRCTIRADLYVNGMDKLVMLIDIGNKPNNYRREFIVRVNDLVKGAKTTIKTLRRTWNFGKDIGFIRMSAKVTRLNLDASTTTKRPTKERTWSSFRPTNNATFTQSVIDVIPSDGIN